MACAPQFCSFSSRSGLFLVLVPRLFAFCVVCVYGWLLPRFLGTGVLRGLTNGLLLLLEHLDWWPLPIGDIGPGLIGVKFKFLQRVLGLGGTDSS